MVLSRLNFFWFSKGHSDRKKEKAEDRIKRWEENIKQVPSMDLVSSTRADEEGHSGKEIVVKSSVVP